MAQASSSTGSGSNQAHAHGSNTSTSRQYPSLTRIRRDTSVEQDEESKVSEYSEISASDSIEDEEDFETRPQKRARGSTASSDQATSKQPKYTVLKTETRQVEARVIKNKWRPTTLAAQAKVKTVLSLVERPVINSNRDLAQRKEAQISLAALSRIIETRLPRMPFPPDTKEWNFDYEAILRNNKDLEQQLAAAKHSGTLAQVEIQKEEKLLADAQEELEELERNAKAEQKARSQRERGISQFWAEASDSRSDGAAEIGLKESNHHVGFEDSRFAFIKELEDHLTKIENNVGQLNDIPDGIGRTSTLLASLERSTYSQ